MVWYQAARHDGCYFCIRRTDGGHGEYKPWRTGRANDIRCHHWRRYCVYFDSTCGEPHVALFPACGHGHTIIAVIGISLMRIGINWIFGNPFGPTAPSIVNPDHAKWLADVTAAANAAGSTVPAVPKGLAIVGSVPNPKYAPMANIGIAALVLVSILMISKFFKGFISNISVLLGIVAVSIIAKKGRDAAN